MVWDFKGKEGRYPINPKLLYHKFCLKIIQSQPFYKHFLLFSLLISIKVVLFFLLQQICKHLRSLGKSLHCKTKKSLYFVKLLGNSGSAPDCPENQSSDKCRERKVCFNQRAGSLGRREAHVTKTSFEDSAQSWQFSKGKRGEHHTESLRRGQTVSFNKRMQAGGLPQSVFQWDLSVLSACGIAEGDPWG